LQPWQRNTRNSGRSATRGSLPTNFIVWAQCVQSGETGDGTWLAERIKGTPDRSLQHRQQRQIPWHFRDRNRSNFALWRDQLGRCEWAGRCAQDNGAAGPDLAKGSVESARLIPIRKLSPVSHLVQE
jgi:hypothetical protein